MNPYYQNNLITLYHADFRDIPYMIDNAIAITDPPYGITLTNHGGNHWDRPAKDYSVNGDHNDSIGNEFLNSWSNRPAIVFASPMKPWPGSWRQYLVWDKGAAVGGGGDPFKCWHYSWELIQVRNTGRLNGKRESAVLNFHISPHNYKYHPTAKPLQLMEYLISKAVTNETVFDPFAGSGSTLIAAQSLSIKAIGIEIEERYCELIAKRLNEAFTFS